MYRRAGGVLSAVCVLLAIPSLSGCGSSPSAKLPRAHGSQPQRALARAALPRPTRATLILDFVPNAVHAGIYRALAAGYYRAVNIDLKVIAPTSTADTLRLIDAGQAEFGLADGSDVATQIDRGRDTQAVMALVQRPLGGLIALAAEHLNSAAQLQGRTVGITGVPSDRATLETAVAHAGGQPRRVHLLTIGFNGAQDLQAGRISAFTGFWPDDGVQLQLAGHPITVFKLDENGGPRYPGLVAFTTRSLIARRRALVRAFISATARGYEDTIEHPTRSLQDLLALNPSLQRGLTAASLKAYGPLFDDGGRVPFGRLREASVRALSVWLRAHGLIHRPISPARYGTGAFLPPGA